MFFGATFPPSIIRQIVAARHGCGMAMATARFGISLAHDVTIQLSDNFDG